MPGCPTLHSQRLYHTAGLGSMRYAIPLAIAVAVANPGREVIAVDGDGGFHLNIQELETIHRLQQRWLQLDPGVAAWLTSARPTLARTRIPGSTSRIFRRWVPATGWEPT